MALFGFCKDIPQKAQEVKNVISKCQDFIDRHKLPDLLVKNTIAELEALVNLFDREQDADRAIHNLFAAQNLDAFEGMYVA